MEDIENTLASSGSTLSTDPHFRMAAPPTGNTFQDFGATNWRKQKPATAKRIYKLTKPARESDDELDSLASGPSQGRSAVSKTPRKKKGVVAALDNILPRQEKKPSRPIKVRQPKRFPMDCPKNRDYDVRSETSSPCSVREVRKPKPKPKPKTRPDDCPHAHPLSSPPIGHHSDSCDDRSDPGKDEDADELMLQPDDEIRTRGGLRPFPMSKEMLETTRTTSRSPSISLAPGPSKSGSKKNASRKLAMFPLSSQMMRPISFSPTTVQCPVQWNPEEDEYDDDEDSSMISPQADPRTLCPYCDAQLPSSPTSTLTALLSRAHKSSYPDPRPANSLGRRAPLQVFIAVCQRHRFENEILPEAERRDWPKSIEWGQLRGRVERMKHPLQALINDQSGFSSAVNGRRSQGPRAKSVFWRETIKEVEKSGSRIVAGVQGQFASFEKTQPGYYGELGSVIIHQTLYSLFPPTEFDTNIIAPLTPGQFIQRILVPEVGVRLIMEDRKLVGDRGVAEAVKILRESANYGVAMFPEDSGEWGNAGGDGEEMGAADMIVMERAMKRRQELEAEERRGEPSTQGEAEKRGRTARKTKDGKRKGKEKEKASGDWQLMQEESDISDACEGRWPKSTQRPQPKPVLPKKADHTSEATHAKSKRLLDNRDVGPMTELDDEQGGLSFFRPALKRPQSVAGSVLSIESGQGSDASDNERPRRVTKTQSRVIGAGGITRKRGGKPKKTKPEDENEEEEEVEIVESSLGRMDPDLTPRPTRYPATDSRANMNERSDVSIAQRKNCRPLMLAREKSRKTTCASGQRDTKGDRWTRSMTEVATSDEDRSSASSSLMRGSEWLLDDSSDDPRSL